MSSEQQSPDQDGADGGGGEGGGGVVENHIPVPPANRRNQSTSQAEPGEETKKHGDQFDPDRKREAESLVDAAAGYYRRAWDVHHISPVEHAGGIYDNYASTKTVIELLDYASIDCIVDTFDAQFGIHERWIMPDRPGERFALRFKTGSKTTSEADKFIRSLDEPEILRPGYAAWGRARSETEFEFFRILSVPAFLQAWQVDEAIQPDDVWVSATDGTGALLFDRETLAEAGVLVAEFENVDDEDGDFQ